MFVQRNAIMKAVIVASGGCFVIVKLLGVQSGSAGVELQMEERVGGDRLKKEH